MSLIPLLVEDLSPKSHHRFGTPYYPRRNLWDHLWENYKGFTHEKILHVGLDGFEVSLDVGHFWPHEITMKSDHHSIVIHAKHEEKQDVHGYISREFTRRYDLPGGFKPEDVKSYFSTDGILTIKCSKPQGSNLCHVPMLQTGPVKQSIKNYEEEKEEM